MTYTADPGTTPNPNGPNALGAAAFVCLTDSTPNCPAGAVSWGYAFGESWISDMSSIPGAWWIWAPGLTRDSAAAGATYWFSRTIAIAGTPLRGSISIAADDFSSVDVNGTTVGSGGAFNSLKTLDIGPLLEAGNNVITVKGSNCGDCGSGPYSDNPAGAVFGGTVTYRQAGESDATETTISSSPPQPGAGQPITFTATVTDTLDPARTPTGAVQFSVDGAAVGSPASLDGAGKARYTTSSLSVGNHNVGANFSDGASFASSSATLAQLVGKADTTTVVSVSPDPTVAGQDASFTATVAAKAPGTGTPTGTVQFADDDGSPIGPPRPLDAAGHAAIDASADAGGYLVHANYSGDPNFNASSATVAQQVNKADTTTRITSSPNPVAPGGTVVFTVTLTVNPPGDVAPEGTVQFTVDGAPLTDPIPLDGATGLTATVTAPTTPQTGTVRAAYSGDANTNPSAASLQQTVAAAAPPATAAKSVTVQQLTALMKTLTKALKGRGLAALTRTAQTFTAAGPGVLVQKVYSPRAPTSATQSKRKNVLIAFGRRTFAVAGKRTLRLKLTAAGRKAGRQTKSLRITIVTRFTPVRGKPVIVIKRLTARTKRKRSPATARSATSSGWRVLNFRNAGRGPTTLVRTAHDRR